MEKPLSKKLRKSNIKNQWGTDTFSPRTHEKISFSENERGSQPSLVCAFRVDHNPNWHLNCKLVRDLEGKAPGEGKPDSWPTENVRHWVFIVSDTRYGDNVFTHIRRCLEVSFYSVKEILHRPSTQKVFLALNKIRHSKKAGLCVTESLCCMEEINTTL